ncbi:hypothetical protein [Pseudomonas syringae]|uniref:hypothetical protein n=1 Tax=Pseudomonas syringae TaxID=317 RepID=UPI001F3484E8|nr:hypothetical protein [Pseudomonas syringae]MCF5724509.1 hypothetical protein [Pseudomonas syringae]
MTRSTLSPVEIKATSAKRVPRNWRAWNAFPESEQRVYQASYIAAYNARILEAALVVLMEKLATLNANLIKALAREAEAIRVAEEQDRIASL